MKRMILFVVVACVAVGAFIGIQSVFAVGEMDFGSGGPIPLPNPLGDDSDFFTLLDRFIEVLTLFAAPVLIALITIAGFLYMFGGADPAKRTTAVKIIKYGIIGFIVIIFARAIAAIVQGVL